MEAKEELLQIHQMVMCTAQVTDETLAEGYTANAVKQLILFYNSIRIRTRREDLDGGLTLIQKKPDKAVDLTGGEWHGWLFYRHPDGQFVSERKLEPWEIMQCEDQRDEGIVLDGGQVLSTKSGIRYA